MPELPDITIYVEALASRLVGERLNRISVRSPFVLRTFDPPIGDLEGGLVHGVKRIGKRVALEFDQKRFLILHLMISGRLQWRDSPLSSKITLANFEFDNGVLSLTEASTKKRASMHVLVGEESLQTLDLGGVEPLVCSLDQFATAISEENRTLKRALTNPRAISGIGNAYSDEILHAARLSPVRLTKSLSEVEIRRLFDSTQKTLLSWTERLRKQFGPRFPGPGEITAFRPDFAVHGKYGQPCPDCGAPVQRIRYAENETNYCARCQNEGRLLADRALSRLLKSDWPKTLEEMSGD